MSNHSTATIAKLVKETNAYISRQEFTAHDIYSAIKLPAKNVIETLDIMHEKKQLLLTDDGKPRKYKRPAAADDSIFDCVFKRRLAEPVEDPDAD